MQKQDIQTPVWDTCFDCLWLETSGRERWCGCDSPKFTMDVIDQDECFSQIKMIGWQFDISDAPNAFIENLPDIRDLRENFDRYEMETMRPEVIEWIKEHCSFARWENYIEIDKRKQTVTPLVYISFAKETQLVFFKLMWFGA